MNLHTIYLNLKLVPYMYTSTKNTETLNYHFNETSLFLRCVLMWFITI